MIQKMTPLTFVLLVGCGLGFDAPFAADIVTPTADGTLPGFLFPEGNDETSAVTGNRYVYEVGIVPDDGIRAHAGIVPGASVTAAPTSGTATYRGRFELEAAVVISGSATEARAGSAFDRSGGIDLALDFDAGTVTGISDERTVNTPDGPLTYERLSVDGQFTADGTLTGTVDFDGDAGELEGLVGGNELIGAFAGLTDDMIFAGGLIANPED